MAAAAQATASAALSADSVQVQQKRHQKKHRHRLSFPCSSFLGNRGFSTGPLLQQNHRSRPASWISPVSEVAVDGSANAAALRLDVKSEEDTPAAEPPATVKEATISSVMADVAKLVKLVDSRDIVELELKHLDCELVIRKKQALLPLPPLAFTAPQIVAQAPYPAYALLPPPLASVPASASAPSPASVAASLPVPAAVPASNLLRILSPMAGTFYKSPAPGEPPFVKVGEKVTKGQVICIVEAMKLMNEIEADQTGTVVEILAEDGKPVAVDTPLFAMKP